MLLLLIIPTLPIDRIGEAMPDSMSVAAIGLLSYI